MMKRIKEKNYEFKHPLASIVIDEVEIGISSKGRRSLASKEIERLSRMAALMFLKKNYRRSMTDSKFTLSAKAVRAIISILKVNQNEFAILIGCQKAKISKIVRNEQAISKSQVLLALERLSMELARPGSIRILLGGNDIDRSEPDPKMVQELNEIRFDKIA